MKSDSYIASKNLNRERNVKIPANNKLFAEMLRVFNDWKYKNSKEIESIEQSKNCGKNFEESMYNKFHQKKKSLAI